MKSIIAVDQGISKCGLAFCREGEAVTSKLVKLPKDMTGGMSSKPLALLWWHDYMRSLIEQYDVAVIEGYAYAMRHTAHQMGEIGGLLRLIIAQQAKPHIVVPIQKVKMMATGKGNANKEAVLLAAYKRLGYPGTSKDHADALWLMQTAIHKLGMTDHPSYVELPKLHTRALDGLPVQTF